MRLGRLASNWLAQTQGKPLSRYGRRSLRVAIPSPLRTVPNGQSLCFEDLADDYIQQHAKPRKRTWKRDEQRLKHDVLPAFGKRKASSVTRSDIHNVLAAIERRGAKVQAQRVFETIRKLFRWAVDNQAHRIRPDLGYPTTNQDRG